MTATAQEPALRAQGLRVGPVQAAVHRRLTAAGFVATSSVAERSPFGRRALRLQPETPDAIRPLTVWLKGQSWTQAVAAVPPNVYVRVRLADLRLWISELGSAAKADVGAGLFATIAYPDPKALSSAGLDVLRDAAVARALAALLTSQGYAVRHVTQATSASAAFRTNGVLGIQIADSSGRGLHQGAIAVAGVDLPQGPLRARHGGTVTVCDLLADLRRSGDGRKRSEDEAHGLASFLMLRCPRLRRLTLDEGKIGADAAAFDALLQTARAPGSVSLAGPVTEGDSLSDLILAMDMTASVAQRAIEAFEPYFFARHLRALAVAATAHLAHDHWLREPAAEVLRVGLGCIALTPREAAPPLRLETTAN